MPTSRARKRRLADEDGFTLFELLIAMAVTAVGLMALVSSFDHSRDLVSVAEKTEVASHQAQRAMERVLAMPYAQVAHSVAPTHDPDTKNPAFYVPVSGGSYQWDQGTTGPRSDDLEVDAVNGQIANISNWQDSASRLTGRTYIFVTRTGDLCPTYTPPAGGTSACTGTERGKRVTVAVTVDGPRPLSRPVLTSSVMINPATTGG